MVDLNTTLTMHIKTLLGINYITLHSLKRACNKALLILNKATGKSCSSVDDTNVQHFYIISVKSFIRLEQSLITPSPALLKSRIQQHTLCFCSVEVSFENNSKGKNGSHMLRNKFYIGELSQTFSQPPIPTGPQIHFPSVRRRT